MRMRFERVTVELPGHRALDDVSGELASGSVTAVIGPSGAGKSTLLGTLAGLIVPDQGKLFFDGEDVTSLRAEKRRLGVVFQDLRLFNFLSARDNVAFAPRIAGLPAAERERRVDAALEQLRAGDFAHRPAGVLSGGERQRIAVARALAASPRALLLDEPFAALDAELRRSIREELRELIRALGLTVLVITHDREDAFALASHFIVLRNGRVVQTGDAPQLYAQPASEYVATLLGEANLFTVDSRAGGVVVIGGLSRAATGIGKRALIRPEQLRLETAGEGWRARVIESRFSGASWRVLLDAGALGNLVAHTAAPPAAEELVVVPPATIHTM